MVEDIVSIRLPVDETFRIRKNVIRNEDGKRLCVVTGVHASNIFLTEIPQVRINELHRDKLVPLAKRSNVDMVWVHANSTVLESTLAYSLNSIGTPCLVVEMGVGMRLTGEYGEQLTDGILNVMKHLGMWDGELASVKTPIVSDEQDEVIFLNAQCSGMFMKTKPHGSWVSKGETVGYVFDPFEGKVVEYVTAAKSGLLFTIRDYPLVDEGSLMGSRFCATRRPIFPSTRRTGNTCWSTSTRWSSRTWRRRAATASCSAASSARRRRKRSSA